MKFCYITRAAIPDYSAQSVQIKAMAKAFSKLLGNDFTLLSSTKKNGVNNEKFDFNWVYKRHIVDRRSHLNQIRFLIFALPKIISPRVEFIFTRDIVVAFLGILFGKKTVYEAHGEFSGAIPEILFNRIKGKKKFFMIAVTDSLRESIIKKHSISEEKTKTLRNGVDTEDYVELRNRDKNVIRKELGLPLDKIIIVHTGSLYKGNDAELFKELLEPDRNQLFIHIGGTPEEQKKWKTYYAEFDNIQFVNHTFDKELIRKYQVSADLLFYSLTYENKIYWCTSPLKLFEYMASGTPILGSNIGSVKEVLNEENAMLFDPLIPSSIKDAFAAFLNERQESERKASNALADTIKHYDHKKRAESILRFVNYE